MKICISLLTEIRTGSTWKDAQEAEELVAGRQKEGHDLPCMFSLTSASCERYDPLHFRRRKGIYMSLVPHNWLPALGTDD